MYKILHTIDTVIGNLSVHFLIATEISTVEKFNNVQAIQTEHEVFSQILIW